MLNVGQLETHPEKIEKINCAPCSKFGSQAVGSDTRGGREVNKREDVKKEVRYC